MQDKAKYLIMFAFILIIGFHERSIVQGYTGKGTEKNPYVVTKETEIREILTTKGSGSWKYIAVNGNITIRKTIVVSKGKFRIYAKGTGRMLKRSGNATDTINNKENPGYCLTVNGTANVVFGYKNGSNHILRLGGNKDNFTGNKKSSGFLFIGRNASAAIDGNALLTNVRNNKSNEGGTAVFSQGTLTVNGEISNCEGTDGGAVGIKNGTLQINSTANIHHCSSQTEGGGVFGISGCSITMNGGTIHHCNAREEGGGIFVGGDSQCTITAGSVTNNTSTLTGGGIFSGNGATLLIGKNNGTGPSISYNTAGTAGGGIRCNGGLGRERGGTTIFYGGYVTDNKANQSAGGISCGTKGDVYYSQIYMRNLHIKNNYAGQKIGGIRIPDSVVGIAGREIYMTNCVIEGNSTGGECGGIMLESTVIAENTNVRSNSSKGNGGGIYIRGGQLQLNSSYVTGNQSKGKGTGVYVAGQLKMKDKSYADQNNEVYLTKGCYIDVVGKLSRSSGLVAKIRSEINVNGTKLVRANYANGTATGELYYPTGNKGERYQCISMSKSQLLRPSENVNGYEKNWIIISEKYKVQYDKNTVDTVENMPDAQDKYWNENIVLSKNQMKREGFLLEDKKYWNRQSDGKGKIYTPGSVYTENGNVTLYVIWKKITVQEIYIHTVNRFYVLHQKVVLNKKELLKKVTTDDDLHTGKQYPLRVTKIDKENQMNVARGEDIITENFINTDLVNQYILTIETRDEESDIKAEVTMRVYVLHSDMFNGQVRFISNEYLSTLDKESKWSMRLNDQLVTSLNKKEIGVYSVKISNRQRNEIKENIRSNNYIIDHEMNQQVVSRLNL